MELAIIKSLFLLSLNDNVINSNHDHATNENSNNFITNSQQYQSKVHNDDNAVKNIDSPTAVVFRDADKTRK